MLATAGLKVPETIEEWKAVLASFKEQGATKPFVVNSIAALKAAFLGAYNVRNNMYIPQGGGAHRIRRAAGGYKQWLKEMNQWYEAGLLDQDIQTADGTVQKTRC